MDTIQNPLQQIQQLSCSIHPSQQLDLLDLTGNSENGRICSICANEKKVSIEYLLPIADIFTKNEGKILNSFPPLKNKEIKKKIQELLNENQSKENIDKFFKQIRIDIEAALQETEKRTKQYFIMHEKSQLDLHEELMKIEEIDKLKKLLLVGGENLNNFLKEKWNNIESNEKRIEKAIQQNYTSLNFEQKYEMTKKITKSLADFNLFDFSRSLTRNINLIKSTYQTSDKFIINKTQQNYLQFINDNPMLSGGQAYLDIILDPKKKYTIKLNYKPNGTKSVFLFGLVSDLEKNENWDWPQMSYCNQNEVNGISKYIKGSNLNYVKRKSLIEEFEVRIFLKEKLLKVATLPTYSKILELDDPNKIKLETPYRFYIYIARPKDVIEITEVVESDKFNDPLF